MNSIQNFWSRVRSRTDQIRQALWLMPEQPQDGTVFVISLDNPGKGTTAGAVTLVPVALAARLIEAGTHAVATAEQIAEYRQQQAKAKQVQGRYREADIAEKIQYRIEENHDVRN